MPFNHDPAMDSPIELADIDSFATRTFASAETSSSITAYEDTGHSSAAAASSSPIPILDLHTARGRARFIQEGPEIVAGLVLTEEKTPEALDIASVSKSDSVSHIESVFRELLDYQR